MANRRRLKGYSGFRVDLPHLRLIESSVTGDFDDVLRGVLTGISKPYIVRGFDVVGSTADINANVRGLRLRVADSVLLHSTATEPGTVLRLSPSEADITLDTTNAKLIGDWVPGVNYVSLDYRRNTDENTVDETKGWSQSEKVELSKAVPIGYVLDYRVIISTVGFGNFLPLFVVEINSSEQITSIELAKDYFFRLGSGGASPNAARNFAWFTAGNPASRIEGPLEMTGALSLSTANSPWERGDFAIKNLKDWMDAVMTRFKEVTGSPYWYADGSFPGGGLQLSKLWWDAAGSVMTSDGSFSLDLKAEINISGAPDENSQALLESTINSTSPFYGVRVNGTSVASTFNVTQRQSNLFTRTLTTSLAHSLTSGDRIEVDGVGANYNGLFVCKAGTAGSTIVYDTATSFTEALTASTGTVSQENGQGIAKRLNGLILRISRVVGLFSPNDSISFRLSQASALITRSGTVATISVPNAHLYGLNGQVGDTFIATVTGAVENNFNRSEVTMTISDDTPGAGEVTYTVANVGAASEAGTFTFDGLLATGTIQSAATSVGAGPLSWDQDFYVRGIIGAKQIRVPFDAVAVGVGPSTSNAGTYGPGTINLEADGQVAYLLLHRDLPLGSNSYNIANNTVSPNPVGQTYTGSDGSTQTVAAGDYVKVEGQSEDKWYKITSGGVLTDIYDVAVSPAVNATGVKLMVSKATYSTIYVARRDYVPPSNDVYWLALRQDRGAVPVVYLRELELELGEERQINDNQATNLLIYTGAMTESATNPNYSTSAPSSAWEYQSAITVSAIEEFQNIVYLATAPLFGIQQNDVLVIGSDTWTVAYPLDPKTFVAKEDVSTITIGAASYRRPNTSFDDTDNLTKGMRKQDRLLARILTILNRPIYDESIHIQLLEMNADAGAQNQTIRSGYWITTSGGGLAWVVAASNNSAVNWPQEVKDALGSTLSNALLIHVIDNPGGTEFDIGATIEQDVPGASSATRTVTAAPDSAELFGDPAGVAGQTIKLPPNTRAGIGNNGSASPTGGFVQPYASYNAKIGKGGGELFLIANDTPRECGVDFLEDVVNYGPAKFPASGLFLTGAAQIQLTRTMPLDTRLRFRNLSTFGIPPVVSSATFTLQTAYDGPGGSGSASGRTIQTSSGALPVEINNTTPTNTALSVGGRLSVSASAGAGIRPATDLGSQVGFSNLRFGEMWLAQQNLSSFGPGQFPGAEVIGKSAGVQTANAAITDLFTQPCQDQRSYRITGVVVARRTDVVGGYAAFRIEANVYRDGAGAILNSAPISTIIGQSVGAANYIATIDVSGNNAIVQVAGDTGHTISWVASIEIQSVSTAV